MKRSILVLGASMALTLAAGAAPAGTDVHVTLRDLKQPSGAVYVSLCRQAEFLTPKCYKTAGRSVLKPGDYTISFTAVEPGTYAVLAFHDVNGNKQIDRDMYGAPLEPTGVSGDVSQVGQMPDFGRSAFPVDDKPVNLSLELH